MKLTEADIARQVRFFVPGLPQPGGSKRAFKHRVTGRIIITEDNPRSKDWRAAVAYGALPHFPAPLHQPLSVRFEFRLPRPKGHFGTGKNARRVRASAPLYPVGRPDTTKLVRSTEDSLKGIAWRDDSQIIEQIADKCYDEPIGAWITVEVLGE